MALRCQAEAAGTDVDAFVPSSSPKGLRRTCDVSIQQIRTCEAPSDSANEWNAVPHCILESTIGLITAASRFTTPHGVKYDHHRQPS
ncbi:MAG: hypothetical protein SFV23_03705, partial [Planctomycetaceae bacterium]|nr:hypothetical protein [Planctomycetaceae bacterium]